MWIFTWFCRVKKMIITNTCNYLNNTLLWCKLLTTSMQSLNLLPFDHGPTSRLPILQAILEISVKMTILFRYSSYWNYLLRYMYINFLGNRPQADWEWQKLHSHAYTHQLLLLSAGRAISSPPRSLVNSGIGYPTRCSKPLEWHVDFGFRWKREMLIKIWVFWMWRYSRLLEMSSWGKFWVNDNAENCLILWYMHTGLVYWLEW
jgi:hypothetical protein